MSVPVLSLACAGTHGSGKTTLTRALGLKLNLEVIDVSRPTTAAQQLGYDKAADVPQDQVQLFQWMGLFEQIHQERIRLERGKEGYSKMVRNKAGSLLEDYQSYCPGFVSDRSTIDFLAYYKYRLPFEAQQQEYATIVETYARKYSAILWLPMNPNGVVDDNRRFVEGTQEIEHYIEQILLSFRLTNIIHVPWDTVENRVNRIISTLEEKKLV